MSKKVTVDEKTCIGCGMCAMSCSDVFEINEEGKAQTKAPWCDKCDMEEIIENCPAQSIKSEEETAGQEGESKKSE